MTELKDTYYLPNFRQTVDGGEFSSERDLEISALKKMAGKNNNAFMMGMRSLDEPVSPALFDGYLEKKAKEQGVELKSSAWEATKGAVEGVVKAPARWAGYAATNTLPLIAKTATSLYALSGAAGGVESADKFIREANKGIEAWSKEVQRITGIDDAGTVENVVGNALGSVWGSVGIGGLFGSATVAPMFGVSAFQDTYTRQREDKSGVGIGEAAIRGVVHGVGEAALESLQLNRIFGALAKKSKPIAIVKDLLENAMQEGVQQANEQAANWNIDNRSLIEKLQEIGASMVGGAVAALGGSVGGNILNRKTIDDVGDLMRKTGRSEEEIASVKNELSKIVDTDELQQAANRVANDELSTVALTYKEQAQAASEELVNQLDSTISRNELVDMPSAISGEQVEMPPLYQLGELQVDTQKNPNLGMVLYQAEQAGQPFQTLGQVLEWTKGKLNVEQAQKMSTGIGAVYENTRQRLKEIGQSEELADRNARIRSAQAFAIARNYGMSVEEADNMLGGITSQKASEFKGNGETRYQMAGVGAKTADINALAKARKMLKDGNNPRGAYYNNTIYLFETANESTFVHEMSHAYMDVVERLAQGGNVQAQRDLDAIRRWLGKKQGEAFTQADWERFARGFEMYMREGKSPNEYLGGTGGVFDKFKNWLMNIYAGIRNLTVTNEKGQQEPVRINRQIKQFYDEMLGGEDIDKVLDTAEKNQQAITMLQNKFDELADAQRVLSEERSRLVREMANNVKPDTTWANVKDWGKNVWESASELPTGLLKSSYARLAKINPRLGLLVQRAEQTQGLRLKKWSDEVKPFFEAFNKLSDTDKAKVQYYLLNQQWGDVEDIIGKDNAEAVQKMLKEVYEELIASGVEVGYRDNYFPRSVLDYDGLLQEMGLSYPALLKEMEEAIGKDATPEAQAEWLDKHIMQFKGNVSVNTNRNTKERKLDLITDKMAKYYKPSMDTLVDYMNGMAKLLSMRDVFGRNIDTKTDSVGAIIDSMFEGKNLSKKEIDEVREVLNALYVSGGRANKFVQALRQYGYATKLSYSTTIRQFADIGMMMKVNGVLNTLDALFHPDKRITLENLGIDPLGEEFKTSQKDIGGGIAQFTTKWRGINWADAVMKNAYMRSNYKSLQDLAKTPDKFHKKYDALFGDETDQLIKDLNDNKISEPVKTLLFHEISKIQPISRSAMPTVYLNNPNGRAFYMFKTFALHRAEYMVIELADDFRRGDLKKAGKDIMADVAVIGWEGLVELLIAFLKYGWQAFAAKEVIDTFAGSGLGVLGLNKHQALQLSRGQVEDFFQEMVGVGTPIDDIAYMIRHYDDDDKLLRAFLPDMIIEPLVAGPKELNKKKKSLR